jgi:lipopolysaccharide transport system ATP-binding protein
MKPILKINGISKKFRISHYSAGYMSFRERVLGIFSMERNKPEDFWALDNITFDVAEGDSLAVVGRNGAGKSTLLKLLSKISSPTKGTITTRGRVASLLEVGTGFHPELTGKENIFFNGSLLGMRRREILQKFEDIVEFSGVEKFLDTPLKHFSSGMQLRLAFAVAAFLEPEIMIIDEVLAVGDAEFQKKCMGKMADVSKSGRTIIFVSHNMAAVENLCTRAILLDQGKIIKDDLVLPVVRHYQNLFSAGNRTKFRTDESEGAAFFRSIEISLHGEQPEHKLFLQTEIKSNSLHKDLFIAVDIANSIGVNVMQAIPRLKPFIPYAPQGQQVNVEIDLPPLIPDTYKVSVWIGPHNSEAVCWLREVVQFEILASPTPGRNVPHSHFNGFMVPHSRLVHGERAN